LRRKEGVEERREEEERRRVCCEIRDSRLLLGPFTDK